MQRTEPLQRGIGREQVFRPVVDHQDPVPDLDRPRDQILILNGSDGGKITCSSIGVLRRDGSFVPSPPALQTRVTTWIREATLWRRRSPRAASRRKPALTKLADAGVSIVGACPDRRSPSCAPRCSSVSSRARDGAAGPRRGDRGSDARGGARRERQGHARARAVLPRARARAARRRARRGGRRGGEDDDRDR